MHVTVWTLGKFTAGQIIIVGYIVTTIVANAIVMVGGWTGVCMNAVHKCSDIVSVHYDKLC